MRSSNHHEKHQADFKLGDVILGGQDGLVNVLGVVLGVAAASNDARLVLAAGLAATFAESVSMAAVAYTSKLAEADHYESERNREIREMEELPQVEEEEIRSIYKRRGFEGELLESIVAKIVSDKKVWLEVMMEEELNLERIDRSKVFPEAILVGFSAVLGSLIPLVPFAFWPIKISIYLSLSISALALLLFGAYKARATVGRPLRSGVQMAVIGIISALVGYLVGLIFRLPQSL